MDFSRRNGMNQYVKESTRGLYLLDLVLSDLGQSLAVSVLPQIADHNRVRINVDMGVPVAVPTQRELWLFKDADWAGLKKALSSLSWKWSLDQARSAVQLIARGGA